jgi:hypothetical protein
VALVAHGIVDPYLERLVTKVGACMPTSAPPDA